MKNLLFLISFIAIGLFSSCSNDADTQSISDNETYELKLNFSSFENEVTPMTRIGQASTSSEIKQYNIYIYNSKGAKVAEKTEQNINKLRIEDVSFYLPKGDYTAVILAFNEKVANYTSTNTSLTTAYAYNKIITSTAFKDCYGCYGLNNKLSSTNYWMNDYFYKKETFTLSRTMTIDVLAPRITGRLELHIQDIEVTNTYPMDYAYVKVTFENFPYGIRFSTDKGYQTSSSQSIYLSKREWESFSKKPIIINSMPTTMSPKITFEFSDSWADCFNPSWSKPVIRYQRVVEGFEVYQNKVTKLTGDIFTSAKFGIEIDTNFDGTINGEL